MRFPQPQPPPAEESPLADVEIDRDDNELCDMDLEYWAGGFSPIRQQEFDNEQERLCLCLALSLSLTQPQPQFGNLAFADGIADSMVMMEEPLDHLEDRLTMGDKEPTPDRRPSLPNPNPFDLLPQDDQFPLFPSSIQSNINREDGNGWGSSEWRKRPRIHKSRPGDILNLSGSVDHSDDDRANWKEADSVHGDREDIALKEPSCKNNGQKGNGKAVGALKRTADEIFTIDGEPMGWVPQEYKNSPRVISCTCSKSQCLKLYCQCFREGILCSSQCKCVKCLNTPQHAESIKVKRIIKDANKKKKENTEEGSGCNCRMSFCEKSYCVCSRNGKGCSPQCKCFNCKNPNGAKNGNREDRNW